MTDSEAEAGSQKPQQHGKPKIGRPSKYDPAFCAAVVELGKAGKSQVQIACALDVDRGTMLGWAERYPEFSTALTRAKAEEQAWWENTGQDALFADKFNSAVWSKSMSARFRDDYTERQKNEHSGPDGGPVPITAVEWSVVASSK